MSAKIVVEGLSELQTWLRQLPVHLTAEAFNVIDDTVEVTAAQLTQSYPLGDTGNLRKGVKTDMTSSNFGVAGIVRSTSKHAHLWEFGTQSRKTKKGWSRGKAPSHKELGLVPIAQRNRKRMNAQLIEIVKKAGFEISGTLDGGSL